MVEQMGPQKLMQQLRDQAPHYAKLVPLLPGMLRAFLEKAGSDRDQLTQELLREQKRTNGLLQSLVYALIGFALGLVVMQWVVRVGVW